MYRFRFFDTHVRGSSSCRCGAQCLSLGCVWAEFPSCVVARLYWQHLLSTFEFRWRQNNLCQFCVNGNISVLACIIIFLSFYILIVYSGSVPVPGVPVVLRIPHFEEPCWSDPNRIDFIISHLHNGGNKASLLPKRTPPTVGTAPVDISALQVAHSGGCSCQLSVVKPMSRVSGSLFLLVFLANFILRRNNSSVQMQLKLVVSSLSEVLICFPC